MTAKLYQDDSYLREFHAEVLAAHDGWLLLSQTAFFPGGGGQPADRGWLTIGDARVDVFDVREDESGRIWHRAGQDLAPGTQLLGTIDWPFRYALMRHHGLMHVVNAVALAEFGGFITGVQIGADRSRIDFKLAGFARERLTDFQERVNAALGRCLAIRTLSITEQEFAARPELVRTLNVLPPVVRGMVRVVEIAGFDAQACGGTHVGSTAEIGPARLAKFDNKGKDNKRFYWEIEPELV